MPEKYASVSGSLVADSPFTGHLPVSEAPTAMPFFDVAGLTTLGLEPQL